MCTDYEIRYACGHHCPPVRIVASNSDLTAEKIAVLYVDCDDMIPTARVFKDCPYFQASGSPCPLQDRLIINQRWDIVCPDNSHCKPITVFDDDDCPLLQKNMESSAISGKKYLDNLSEKQRAELYKTSTRISQTPVWGRKGPHVKKPRKVKTKEERERDKEEKARKEAEKAEVAAAQALAELASGKGKTRHKKSKTNRLEPVGHVGRKRKIDDMVEVNEELGSTKKGKKKKKAEPKAKGKRSATDTEEQPLKPAPKKSRRGNGI